MDCAAVAQLDLTGVTDAPVTIQSATVVTTGAPAPYCAVRGTIAPADTFVMRLPTQGWTQRYVQTGCGGLCGSANINYTEAATCPPIADGTILFPGVTHCGGGEGPDTFDILTPVMAWVESGIAPGEIIASKAVNGAVTRTRPVFPYPTVARYVGSGSINDAANFIAFTPHNTEPGPNADYSWVGKRLYSHGYQAGCQAVGTELVCDPSRLLPGHEDLSQ